MRRRISSVPAAFLGLASLLAAGSGCGGRGAAWDTPVSGAVTVGELAHAAVLIDSSLNRALVVHALADQTLTTTAVPVGKRIALTATSPTRDRVFVLSQGDEVRLGPNDEGPALTVFEDGQPEMPKRYPLPDPLTSLVIDPEGKFAIVYAGDSTQSSFLTNPNELVFVDLANAPSQGIPNTADNPATRTLPSKEGGVPKHLTFSPDLDFPSGKRRLLIVETDRDVVLVDVDHLDRGEITLPVTDPHTDTRALSPAGIAVEPGDSTLTPPRPPAIAIRTATDNNVLLYKLEPSVANASGNDFLPNPNAASTGGVPSDIAFVQTSLRTPGMDNDKGKRLAVIVPSPTPQALLVNIDDLSTLTATLSQPYQNLSLVTSGVSNASPNGDQVMLWAGGGASSVALWDLSALPSVSQADIDTVKSVDTMNLDGSVQSVTDVTNTGFQNLKVLQTSAQSLYVLDLDEHQASPLNASSAVSLRLGLDGDRAWAFQGSQTNLAQVTLGSAHVQTVVIDRAVDDVLEVRRSDDDNGRALLALHGVSSSAMVGSYGSTVGITVYDALKPDVSTARRYSSVMLERLAP